MQNYLHYGMASQWVNQNGKLAAAADPTWNTFHRAIHYGDGLFETIRLLEGEFLFLDDHIHRLLSGMKALRISIPAEFTAFSFHKQIVDLARLNKVGANARIRIGVIRSIGGLYRPMANSAEYFIEITALPSGYVWSPLTLGIYSGIRKDFSDISPFKTMNALPYILAALHAGDLGTDDCLLLNSQGRVADATSSNIFCMQGDRFYTPSVNEGCVEGIMRKNVVALLQKSGHLVTEQPVDPGTLRSADEIFLTNTGWGLRPVIEFDGQQKPIARSADLFENIQKTWGLSRPG